MSEAKVISPALSAAQEAEKQVSLCLKQGRSFLLEAGAGAGKTYSLVEALKYLLTAERDRLRRNNQQIACITYTNAATAIITNRIDGDKLVAVSTIHSFCWSLIKAFQPLLRKELLALEAWGELVVEAGELGNRRVEYELGYRKVTDELISIHHDDVLALTARLMSLEKFKTILAGRYPYVFIDEYQDTSIETMSAIKDHLLSRKGGPLIGLFGDHWQRIYDSTCGHVSDEALEEIGKKANFRSSTAVVNVLNKMRPELPQAVRDEAFIGSAEVFHTNSWVGTRRTGAGGGHWKDDLPSDIAHQYLDSCIAALKISGWDFSPEKTKILLLTHNGLAAEQGYAQLAKVFPYTDLFIKKTDEHIKFFADRLEPASVAFKSRRYGLMYDILGDVAPRLSSHAVKEKWSEAMAAMMHLRQTGTIGQVIDHLLAVGYPKLPEKMYRREKEAREWQDSVDIETPEIVTRIRAMRALPYKEVIALVQYLEGHTPFATKHSVKGDEFENVLVVLGRGWNKYNFDQFLEWFATPASIPADKAETYERNRNLFYVCCSRPTTRLALLFTQKLSANSLRKLTNLFGSNHLYDVGSAQFPVLPPLNQAAADVG
jgi:DNA helicase-2/ATP-dependent DNA helicase PcrA